MQKDSRSRFPVHVLVVLSALPFLLLLAGHCQRVRYGRTVSIQGRDTLNAAVSLRYPMYDSRRVMYVGLQYDLLKRYGDAQGIYLDVSISQGDTVDWWSELMNGRVDILVTELSDSVIPRKKDSVFMSIPMDDYVWVVTKDDSRLLDNINIWLGWYIQSSEYNSLRTGFLRLFRNADTSYVGKMAMISPYDDLFRKYASTIGWDWRLLASLVYQESRFSMSTISGRDAAGLMQVRPAAATKYGVRNVFDPEDNLRAGVKYIEKLMDMFPYPEYDSLNIIKFTLAAYNCGEGRIRDCIRFADSNGCDVHEWDEVAEVIPLMRKRSGSDLSMLTLGSFNGKQTVQYVSDIMNRFEEYKRMVDE